MYKKLALLFGVLAFLAWHPITRPLMWLLLPLGYKPDDLLAILLIFVFGTLWVWGFTNIPNKIKGVLKREE